MTPDHITGAELQTLREACGLSREELATMAHVQARSIKHWEQGRMAAPADVAAMVQALNLAIDHAAHIQARTYQGGALIRYRSEADIKRFLSKPLKHPLGAHGAIVGRAWAILKAQGKACRIVWMHPEAYEAWRQATGLPDSLKSIDLWAVGQISAQSAPFKADLHPKSTEPAHAMGQQD